VQLAASTWAIDLLRDLDELSKLFSKNWRLDYQSPIVRGFYDVCAARLRTWRYEL
jgi:hypothetical protein